MSKTTNNKRNLAVDIVAVLLSAAIGAILSVISGVLMLMIVWGFTDSATFGIIGLPIGFVSGGVLSILLLVRQVSRWKSIGLSLLGAPLISCMLIVVSMDFLGV